MCGPFNPGTMAKRSHLPKMPQPAVHGFWCSRCVRQSSALVPMLEMPHAIQRDLRYRLPPTPHSTERLVSGGPFHGGFQGPGAGHTIGAHSGVSYEPAFFMKE